MEEIQEWRLSDWGREEEDRMSQSASNHCIGIRREDTSRRGYESLDDFNPRIPEILQDNFTFQVEDVALTESIRKA